MWIKAKKYVVAFALFLAGFAALYAKWQSDVRAAVAHQRLQDEVDAHERINGADTGGGATDAERVKRLRDMADQLRD